MKGKIFKYNTETGKIEEIASAEFALPCPKHAASGPTGILLGGVIRGRMEMNKDGFRSMLNEADKAAEGLDRRACLEAQELIQELRETLE
jgi:hypothetical protein